tara:strand:+ start:679 stop:870 length:192 start_codon:yes stop_codon:yes gene_type:complete
MSKKKSKLTEEEIKQRRREYMKRYYKKKTFQMDDKGKFVKRKPKEPSVPPLVITRKEVIVSFK